MKIIQIITQQEAGGAQSRAVKMMRELQRRGHEVTTVFLFLKRPAFADAPDIVNIWPRRPRAHELPALFARLWLYLRRERADIVMPYTHWANVLVAPIARLAGSRNVFANQTQVPSREPRLAQLVDVAWGAMGFYSVKICNSATTEAEMRERISRGYAKRLRTVSLGVDIPRTALSRGELRAKFALPDAFLLMHVGRLSRQKNHAAILRALAEIPQAHLACVGDGELREELSHLEQELGLSDRVHWLGERPAAEVAELLQAADLFVFPSLWEGFGLAPVEAASAGLPIVASDIPTFSEVLRLRSGPDAGTLAAVTVLPEAPHELARQVRALMGDAGALTRLREKAEQLGRQYSLAGMTDDYERIFQEAT